MSAFSVIVPARNAQRTLDACLGSIFASSAVPGEVWVIDDGSADETALIATRFSCRRFKVDIGQGPMQPRFVGAEAAVGPLLVFVDSDICVRPDTFLRILKHFEDPGVVAVTGILSSGARTENFFSAFKNEYMHHVFAKQPRDSAFLYGSLWAIRKPDLIVFNPISRPFGSLVSDSEMGIRLVRKHGGGLVLDHALTVDHLKRHSFGSLLKNDFVIPFMFSLMLLKYGGLASIYKRKSFSHARIGQVVAAACSFASWCLLVTGLALGDPLATPLFAGAIVGFSAVGIYWTGFLVQLNKNRGSAFCLGSCLFIPLDQAVMFAGMMSGLIFGLPNAGLRKS